MKRSVILVNPYSRSEAACYQPRRLQEELVRLGVAADILPNRYRALIEGGNLHFPDDGSGRALTGYDACIYLDKDKYTPRMLERKGMRLFNRAAAVEVCDDKMLTSIALADAGIPMPKTLPAPLCYDRSADAAGEAAAVGAQFGLPVVVKESYGSLGKQVYLAETEPELAALCRRLATVPHLYQEFVEESRGRDLRVICVGGEIVAAMERSNPADFRSNLALGGRGEARVPDATARDLCRKVTALLSLDYCGIDLLFGPHGYLVCEVNSNAFFAGMEQTTGINVAARYAAHICSTM